MMVKIKAGGHQVVLAPPHIVCALFATISFRLEPNGIGTRFPLLTSHLYISHLRASQVAAAYAEAAVVEKGLKQLSKESVVWSLDDLCRREDTGESVNQAAHDAFDYFVSADGRPLFAVLQEELAYAHSRGGSVWISFPTERLISPKDLLCLVIGILWIVLGRFFLSNEIIRPTVGGLKGGWPFWTAGLLFVVAGIAGPLGRRFPALNYAQNMKDLVKWAVAILFAFAVFFYFTWRS